MARTETGFQFRLFGIPALLDREGTEVRLRTRKQYALVLHLTLEGQQRPVHRDRLAELIWPAVSTDRGRHSLSQAMTELRERLGADLFSRGGNTLRLDQRIGTELDAIANGVIPPVPLEPLVGVDGWAGAEFAQWADAARQRIVREVGDALQDIVAGFRRTGRLADAGSAAGVLYTLDPYSELAVHTLAEQALVTGRATQAIRLLRTHVSRVAEELQCDAQPQVTRLLKRLESGDGGIVDGTRRTVSPPPASPDRELVGRHEELARLEAEWQDVAVGALHTCLISGAGGIGKSALLRRFATSLMARGAPVFRVSCQEIGAGIPFSAAAELVGALAREPGMSAASPALLSDIARIVPSLRVRYPGIPQPDPIAPEAIRIRLAEALAHVVDSIADGAPVAITIDDLQHIDPASRDLLFLLERRLAGAPLLLLAALRSPSARAGDSSTTEGLVWQSTLALDPLSRDEAADLVAKLCVEAGPPPAAVASKIIELGGGNPYFVELLVADWHSHTRSSVVQVALLPAPPEGDWQPPRDLRVAFARQFERMSDTARSVLHILATARRGMGTEQLTSLIGCLETETDRALLELATAGLTQPSGNGAAFKNDLHRAYVYYSMEATIRQWYHSRLASQLDAVRPPNRSVELEIGTHHLEAGESASATVRLLSGAGGAIAVAAYGEAESALRRLISTLDVHEGVFVEALGLLGESLRGQGKYREVIQLFDDHQDLIAHRNPVPRMSVLRAEALQRNHEHNDVEISEAATQALDLARRSGNLELYLRALQTAAESVSEMGASADGLRAIELEATEVAQSPTPRHIRARAFMTAGYCQFSTHAWEEAARSFRASAACFSERGHDNERMRVLNGLGATLLNGTQFSEGVNALVSSLILATDTQDDAHCTTVLSNLGAAYEWMGLFNDADLFHATGRDYATRCGIARKVVEAYLNSFDLALIKGHFGEAESFLEVAAKAAQVSGSARFKARVLLATADMHIASGEAEFAWPLVAEAARMTEWRGWMLDNSGRYQRLVEHFAYATGKRLTSKTASTRTSVCEIEVRAVREQIVAERGATRQSEALRLARTLGLYGVVGRLAAVRIYVGPEPEDGSVTGAQYVANLFPHRGRPERIEPATAHLARAKVRVGGAAASS